MIKIGITGSLASGKTTAAQIISISKFPVFSADKSVQEIYKKKLFAKKLIRKFYLKKKNTSQITNQKINN